MALVLLLLGMYYPEQWQFYPAMDEIRCISFSPSQLFVAVPQGVYIFSRPDYDYVRCLARADGIAEEVELCAWNPGRSSLFISTASRLYEYVQSIDLLSQLFPPFQEVRSIGIVANGAYFDTDKGLFKKDRASPQFSPVQSAPDNTVWYGQLDTSRPQDFGFLSPYFVTDQQLNTYPMAMVRADPQRRKLFVAARDYGLLVYSTFTKVQEAHIRLGPLPDADRVVRLDQRLWFLSPYRSASFDSLGNWSYYFTRAGDLPAPGFRLLFGNVAELGRRERLDAVLPDSGRLLLGTDYGLYALGEKGRLATVIRLNRPVYGLARLQDSVLVGTDQGLFLLKHDTLLNITDPFGRSDWGVYDIVQASTGLYLANLGGVTARANDGTWNRLVPPGFDLSQPVRTMAAGDSFLFVGSRTDVSAFDLRSQLWTQVDSSMGLVQSEVQGLWADDRYLWIASPGLLSRFEYRRALK